MVVDVSKVKSVNVRKRSGDIVDFDRLKIFKAIKGAWIEHLESTNEELSKLHLDIIENLTDKIVNVVFGKVNGCPIGIEQIQDIVENSLMANQHYEIARRYITYRNDRAKLRKNRQKFNPNAISEFIHLRKYAKYLHDKKRRETFNETIARVENMYLSKFPNLKDEIIESMNMVRDKRILPSMRVMQYAGKAIEVNNARIYNCSAGICNRIEFFRDAYYLLLSGVGVGYSVQFEHVDQLPPLAIQINNDNVIHHVVEDTIEGWANALDALLKSYVNGTYIEFSYHKIRSKGSILKTSGGRAPGHLPLKKALGRIIGILNSALGRKLKPIECNDIMCHIADSVLAGGNRESATICLFSDDDFEMMNAKTGDWYSKYPHRCRSNNSIILNRADVKKSHFKRVFKRTKEWGEPGFVFTNDNEVTYNPCQPGFAPVITKNGIVRFDNLHEGDEIWSESGWAKVIKHWSTGIKPVYMYRTTSGIFYGTANHRIINNGAKIEVSESDCIDILAGPKSNGSVIHNINTVMDGLVIGDGSRHLKSHNKELLIIGKNDQDYFSSEIKDLIICKHPSGYNNGYYTVNTNINYYELDELPYRRIPDRYKYANFNTICSFLRGLYSANGSVINPIGTSIRVKLKSASKDMVDDVQIMLSAVGIRSYISVNKSRPVEWHNGTYISKESYDINITTDSDIFYNSIGFIQNYKNDELHRLLENRTIGSNNKNTYEIIDVKYLGDMEVFDVSVDNDKHTYWTGGCNVSNCLEISMKPIYTVKDQEDADRIKKLYNVKVKPGSKHYGFQFCNLTEINAAKCDTQEDLLKAAKAATILGTIQASYTDFPFLGWATQEITRRESLLGVSMTGIMDSPYIALDPDIQSMAAELCIEVNKEIASKIGINQAARITCCKPAGSTSLMFGSVGSGIHPHHSRRYFRRIRISKMDPMYKFFNKHNPHMVETLASNNDMAIITFCVEAPTSATIKSDLSAIDFLNKVLLTQKNWVIKGTARPDSLPNTYHNVSNTVLVKDDEWDEVMAFIWKNRKFFTGISFLSYDGDKKCPQMPYESVITEEDEMKWNMLINKYKPMDYTLMEELNDNTVHTQEASCAGGKCDLL